MPEAVAIKVNHVSKSFKLPHEKQSSIKSALINISKGNKRKRSYERQQALNDVSFEIKEGDFFAIVGRNGSGKSTLLKMLAGIYSPTKGSIQVNGKLTPFIELGVGFNPELTGRENVFLNGALLGFNRKEMNNMYQDIVDFAEIERFMDQKLKNYSSGMQVRLAFSIAIRAKSDILLLDEVLAVGDAAFQQKCYDYFEELKRQKRTVVFVSHDMSAVTRFCNKAVYIKNGDLVLKGSPAEVADLYREENIDKVPLSASAGSKDSRVKPQSGIDCKLVKQDASSVTFEINFKTKIPDELYTGISILRDGFSIAEITTPLEKPFTKKGILHYTVDTRILNGGAYDFSAALFKLSNRELIAFSRQNGRFVVKGSDITKGASLKLNNTWKYL